MKQELEKETLERSGRSTGGQPGTGGGGPKPAKIKVKWSKTDDSPYNRLVIKIPY